MPMVSPLATILQFHDSEINSIVTPGKPYVLPTVRAVGPAVLSRRLQILMKIIVISGGNQHYGSSPQQGVRWNHWIGGVHQAGRHPRLRKGLEAAQGRSSKSLLCIICFPRRVLVISSSVEGVRGYRRDGVELSTSECRVLTTSWGQIAITQSISGTGALRIGGEFFARFYPGPKAIYLPTPTWGNHIPIMKDSGLEVKSYAYYDKKTVGLDFEGMKRDMRVGLVISIIKFSEKGCSD